MPTDCCKLEKPCDDHLIKALGKNNIPDLTKVSYVDIGKVANGMKVQFTLFQDGKVPEENILAAIKWMARNHHILYDGKPMVYFVSDKI